MKQKLIVEYKFPKLKLKVSLIFGMSLIFSKLYREKFSEKSKFKESIIIII